jgi:hypothetical protein
MQEGDQTQNERAGIELFCIRDDAFTSDTPDMCAHELDRDHEWGGEKYRP